MELTEKLEGVQELTHKLKQDWVDSEPENTDLGIYLHFWRGEEIVVGVQCLLDRDAALHAGTIGAMGFNADAMSVTFESFHSMLQDSPITNKPWKHQEMQYVAETYPEAAEKGWVNSCITTTIHERSGAYGLVSQPYMLDGKKLIWYPDRDTTVSSANPGEHGGGYMFDVLQQAMTQPTMEAQITEAAKKDDMARLMTALVNDPEHRLFHSDMATARTLEERGLVSALVFSAEPGTKREEWLRERFGDPDLD